MLKKALKISLFISFLGLILLGGGLFLTKTMKNAIKKAERTVPELVEYTTPTVISEEKMRKKVEKKLKKKTDIFSLKYQKAAGSVLGGLKKKRKYSLMDPLLVVNPFGTNETGLYVFFKHGFRVNVKYRVSVKKPDATEEFDLPDFSESLYTNTSNLPLAEQEGQIIGLIPGRKNYVSLYLYDEEESLVAKAGYRIELPPTKEEMKERLHAELDREVEQLSKGLFVLFGLHPNEKERSLPFYDNLGILRARLKMKKGAEDVNLKFLDGRLFYAIDKRSYALVNPLGKIEKIFSFAKGYETYGDFDFTPANRYMLTFGKKGSRKNLLLAIDLYDGKTWEILDFNTFLKNKEKDFQFSSIRIMNDNDILVSEKSTSSILRIDNVFRRPEAKALIGGEELRKAFKEISYEKEGDFTSHLHQSAVYMDRNQSMDKRSYRIFVLNHDGKKEGTLCYEYLLDEAKKTYELISTLTLPGASVNGGISRDEDSLILSLSEAGLISEFNKDGNMVAKYSLKGESFYKAMKFDMKGSWFTK